MGHVDTMGGERSFATNRRKVSFAASLNAQKRFVRLPYPGENGRTYHYLA